jgi:pseudaminic acid biosynthesis-associated methylase
MIKNKSLTKYSDQEIFWAGEFGDKYIKRNNALTLYISNIQLFSKIISIVGPIDSAIEFGPNIGLNLKAIKTILPKIKLTAVEINKKACDYLVKMKFLKVYNQSMIEYKNTMKYDLSFTKGVLIHLGPDQIQKAYRVLYNSSSRFILLAEYYNPSEQEILYQGYKGKLYRRDFAGEIMKKYSGKLKLIEYGFVYHQDKFPLDDITWFLLEKVK